MKVLTGLEPKRVFEIFEEFSAIARPSGHEQKAADYIESFAKKNGLKSVRDKFNNVVIYKKASSKDAAKKTIILQAHIDMVCEKELGKNIDFLNDSISLVRDGDFVRAQGTTLGADNGIGVAMILAVLEDKNLKHPNIEGVFTTEEETTMNGAKKFNAKLLQGKHFISLDTTDEGKMITGCAGFSSFKFSIKSKIQEVEQNKKTFRITLNGFTGGHSGDDIAKGRGNAIVEIARFLNGLSFSNLVSLTGGGKVNSIARSAVAEVCVDEKKVKKLKKETAKFDKRLKKHFKETDSAAELSIIDCDAKTMLPKSVGKSLVLLLTDLKNGPKSFYKNALVKASQNVGVVNTGETTQVLVSMRSSDEGEAKKFCRENELIAKRLGFKFEIVSQNPFFNLNENSDFAKKCAQSFKKVLNTNVVNEKIHASVEAGIFADKIKGLEICLFAPNLFDIHSPSERLSISSTERVYKVLQNILEEF